MILDKILIEKKNEVEQRKLTKTVGELKSAINDIAKPLDFENSIVNKNNIPSVIAEVKKASPSKGIIRADFNPVEIAQSYEKAGASAISVLTDEKFFQGSMNYLIDIKKNISLPVLRKDFVIDEYQIFEARFAEADAVLLIVSALEKSLLKDLYELSKSLGLGVLVEIHDEKETYTAIDIGASLIGINNRNLQTFEVSLDTTFGLYSVIKKSCSAKVVSESGIFTRSDIEKLGNIGIDGVLIGEALMRENDIELKLRELIG